MIEDLEKGDVAETAKTFFEQSSVCKPAKTSTLTLSEVNESLITAGTNIPTLQNILLHMIFLSLCSVY